MGDAARAGGMSGTGGMSGMSAMDGTVGTSDMGSALEKK